MHMQHNKGKSLLNPLRRNHLSEYQSIGRSRGYEERSLTTAARFIV